MVAADATEQPSTIPVELTAWVTRLRAGVIVGMLLMLLAARTLAHLPIPLAPVVATAIGAAVYNAVLSAVVRRTKEQPTADADRARTWVLYAGGFLDTVAIALIALFTGGRISPWLYLFLATSIVSSAVLPPRPGRVLTALNAVGALLVVLLPVVAGAPPPSVWWSDSGYAAIVGLSLVGLMGLTAYAVSVPVESARTAARFQEGLARLIWTVQRTAGVQPALVAACDHAHEWFGVDQTNIWVLEGEQLVLRAVTGSGTGGLGRRLQVSADLALEVEALRRRNGFYVNHARRSAYASYALVRDNSAEAVLLVPLLGSLGIFGVLTMVDRRHGGRFTPTVLERARILATQIGIAVENTRLLDRVREEAESVTALLGASERLTKSADLSTLLTDLNRLAAEMVGCERSTTFMWDAHRGVFHFGSTFGSPAAVADTIRQLEFARGAHPLIEKVLAGETFVISAAQAAAQLPEGLRHSVRLGASAIVPLKTEDALQGVMTVSYADSTRDFSAEQLWLLRGIARHAALAIERARLIAQEREATATAEALVALGRELSATLDRQQVLSRIPEMAATAAGCHFAVLSFWDSTTANVRIVGAHGFSPEATEQLLQSSFKAPVSAFTHAVLRDGYFEALHPQPLLDVVSGIGEHFQATSLLCFLFGPIDQHIGGLTVGYRMRTGPFSAAQKRLINGIAQHAAVVLENSRLIEDLREANRLKSDFLSTVSHELRTPLNAIIGYTDLVREHALGPLLPEQREVMDIVAKKGQQLLELINTTLDVTRMEAGQMRVEVRAFDIGDLLDEIHHELADEVPPLVTFDCVVAPNIPRVHSDRAKLKTVIKNLAHNALKFTHNGAVEVSAVPAPQTPHLQIVVRDTGIGIAPENLRLIFEMFRQVEPAMTRQHGGVGLGLYIVRRLLEMIGGEIHVHSELEKGSVFTVSVPCRLDR